MSKNVITLQLSGRIDSVAAPKVEEDLFEKLREAAPDEVILDASDLEYISSSGLRVLLRIKKAYSALSVVNVSSEVYEILDMTGFTEMMTVRRAFRSVSIDNCEEIGRGANGTVYRIDNDNVVKVYNNPDALDDIQHEREVARLALILGVPTAISYDVVRVGDKYGSVFELLNAKSFSRILATEPDKTDWCVNEYVTMLKRIHSTLVPSGKLPSIKQTVKGWAAFMKDYLPAEDGEKLCRMVEEIPESDYMIHGDYHTGNLELQNDEVLLIDMDTLSVGDPIFELASIFNAFVGFSEIDHDVIMRFHGIPFERGVLFWKKFLSAYLGTNDAAKLTDVENKARIIGYTRLIRRLIRRGGLENEKTLAEINFWKKELLDLLAVTDSLIISED